MTPDLRLCRTHNITSGLHPSAGPGCDIVALVWSADGLALLAIEQCDEPGYSGIPHGFWTAGTINPPEGSNLLSPSFVNCPKCGGSGWRYAADTFDDGKPVTSLGRVAVVPLRGG